MPEIFDIKSGKKIEEKPESEKPKESISFSELKEKTDAEEAYGVSSTSLSKEKYVRLYKLQLKINHRSSGFSDKESYKNWKELKTKTKEELEKIFDSYSDDDLVKNPSFSLPFLNMLKEKSEPKIIKPK